MKMILPLLVFAAGFSSLIPASAQAGDHFCPPGRGFCDLPVYRERCVIEYDCHDHPVCEWRDFTPSCELGCGGHGDGKYGAQRGGQKYGNARGKVDTKRGGPDYVPDAAKAAEKPVSKPADKDAVKDGGRCTHKHGKTVKKNAGKAVEKEETETVVEEVEKNAEKDDAHSGHDHGKVAGKVAETDDDHSGHDHGKAAGKDAEKDDAYRGHNHGKAVKKDEEQVGETVGEKEETEDDAKNRGN